MKPACDCRCCEALEVALCPALALQQMSELAKHDVIEAVRPYAAKEGLLPTKTWRTHPITLDCLRSLARRLRINHARNGAGNFWARHRTRVGLAAAIKAHVDVYLATNPTALQQAADAAAAASRAAKVRAGDAGVSRRGAPVDLELLAVPHIGVYVPEMMPPLPCLEDRTELRQMLLEMDSEEAGESKSAAGVHGTWATGRSSRLASGAAGQAGPHAWGAPDEDAARAHALTNLRDTMQLSEYRGDSFGASASARGVTYQSRLPAEVLQTPMPVSALRASRQSLASQAEHERLRQQIMQASDTGSHIRSDPSLHSAALRASYDTLPLDAAALAEDEPEFRPQRHAGLPLLNTGQFAGAEDSSDAESERSVQRRSTQALVPEAYLPPGGSFRAEWATLLDLHAPGLQDGKEGDEDADFPDSDSAIDYDDYDAGFMPDASASPDGQAQRPDSKMQSRTLALSSLSADDSEAQLIGQDEMPVLRAGSAAHKRRKQAQQLRDSARARRHAGSDFRTRMQTEHGIDGSGYRQLPSMASAGWAVVAANQAHGEEDSSALRASLQQQAVAALRHLTQSPSLRVAIIAEGAYRALTQVLAQTTAPGARWQCAIAICYLSAVQPSVEPPQALLKCLAHSPASAGAAARQRQQALMAAAYGCAVVDVQGNEAVAAWQAMWTALLTSMEQHRHWSSADQESDAEQLGGHPASIQARAASLVRRMSSKRLVRSFSSTSSRAQPPAAPAVASAGKADDDLSVVQSVSADSDSTHGSRGASYASDSDGGSGDAPIEGLERDAVELGVAHVLAGMARVATGNLRCVLATSLFNLTCQPRNVGRIALEGGAEALVAMMVPHTGDERAGGDVGVAQDAFVLAVAARALANLVTSPAGRAAVLHAGLLGVLMRWWFWYSPQLQVVIGAAVLEPLCRKHTHLLRVADDGVCVLLRDVVAGIYGRWHATIGVPGPHGHLVHTGPEPAREPPLTWQLVHEAWALRKCVLALSRLAHSRKGASQLIRGFGTCALAECVHMLTASGLGASLDERLARTATAASRAGAQDSAGTPGQAKFSSLVSNPYSSGAQAHWYSLSRVADLLSKLRVQRVLRKVSVSFARLSWHSEALIVVQHGAAGGAAAALLYELRRWQHARTRDPAADLDIRLLHMSVSALANVFRTSAASAEAAEAQGAVAALTEAVMCLRPRAVMASVQRAHSQRRREAELKLRGKAAATPHGPRPSAQLVGVAGSADLSGSIASTGTSPVPAAAAAAAAAPVSSVLDLPRLLAEAALALYNATCWTNVGRAMMDGYAPVCPPVVHRPVFDGARLPARASAATTSASLDSCKSSKLAMAALRMVHAPRSALGVGRPVIAVCRLMREAYAALQIAGVQNTVFPGSAASLQRRHSSAAVPTSGSKLLESMAEATGGQTPVDRVKSWGCMADGTLAPPVMPQTCRVLSSCIAALRNLSDLSSKLTGRGVYQRRLVRSGVLPLVLLPLMSRSLPDTPISPRQSDAGLTHGAWQHLSEREVAAMQVLRLELIPVVLAFKARRAAARLDKLDDSDIILHSEEPPATFSQAGHPLLEALGSSQFMGAWWSRASASEKLIFNADTALLIPDKAALLPVSCIVDAVHVVSNLSADDACRPLLVGRGVVPFLVPIAAASPNSPLALSYQLSGRQLTHMHLDQVRRDALAAQLRSNLYGESMLGQREASEALPAASPTASEGEPGFLGGSNGSNAPRRPASPQHRPEKPVGLLTSVDDPSMVDPELWNAHTVMETNSNKAVALSALALCNLATDLRSALVAHKRGMLQALHALTNFGADDDLILLRVASALRKMTSADPSMVHTLLEERVLPAVVAMCSSNLESIRHEALGVLYNVALVPSSAPALLQSGAVRILVSTSMIRDHDPQHVALCLESLYNSLANEGTRSQVLEEGLPWALQKLCHSPSLLVQRIVALTIYRLCQNPDTQTLLLKQGTIKAVIDVMRSKLRPPPASEAQRASQAQLSLSSRSRSGSRRALPQRDMIDEAQAPVEAIAGKDALTDSIFASALTHISNRPGHERILAADGGIEALVLLGNDEDLATQQRAEVAAARAQQQALRRQRRRGPPTAGTPGAPATTESGVSVTQHQRFTFVQSPKSGVDAIADVAKHAAQLVLADAHSLNVHSSCASGLFNFSASTDPSVLARVLKDGGAQLLCHIARAEETRLATRLKCVLAIANLLRGLQPAQRQELVSLGASGAVSAFLLHVLALQADPTKLLELNEEPSPALDTWLHRACFVCVSTLHFISCSQAPAPSLNTTRRWCLAVNATLHSPTSMAASLPELREIGAELNQAPAYSRRASYAPTPDDDAGSVIAGGEVKRAKAAFKQLPPLFAGLPGRDASSPNARVVMADTGPSPRASTASVSLQSQRASPSDADHVSEEAHKEMVQHLLQGKALQACLQVLLAYAQQPEANTSAERLESAALAASLMSNMARSRRALKLMATDSGVALQVLSAAVVRASQNQGKRQQEQPAWSASHGRPQLQLLSLATAEALSTGSASVPALLGVLQDEGMACLAAAAKRRGLSQTLLQSGAIAAVGAVLSSPASLWKARARALVLLRCVSALPDGPASVLLPGSAPSSSLANAGLLRPGPVTAMPERLLSTLQQSPNALLHALRMLALQCGGGSVSGQQRTGPDISPTMRASSPTKAVTSPIPSAARTGFAPAVPRTTSTSEVPDDSVIGHDYEASMRGAEGSDQSLLREAALPLLFQAQDVSLFALTSLLTLPAALPDILAPSLLYDEATQNADAHDDVMTTFVAASVSEHERTAALMDEAAGLSLPALHYMDRFSGRCSTALLESLQLVADASYETDALGAGRKPGDDGDALVPALAGAIWEGSAPLPAAMQAIASAASRTGRIGTVHMRHARERYERLRFVVCADAARVLCNFAYDSAVHAVLSASGAAVALISVADSTFCAKSLRNACLRALCSLAIQSQDDSAVSQELSEEAVHQRYAALLHSFSTPRIADTRAKPRTTTSMRRRAEAAAAASDETGGAAAAADAAKASDADSEPTASPEQAPMPVTTPVSTAGVDTSELLTAPGSYGTMLPASVMALSGQASNNISASAVAALINMMKEASKADIMPGNSRLFLPEPAYDDAVLHPDTRAGSRSHPCLYTGVCMGNRTADIEASSMPVPLALGESRWMHTRIPIASTDVPDVAMPLLVKSLGCAVAIAAGMSIRTELDVREQARRAAVGSEQRRGEDEGIVRVLPSPAFDVDMLNEVQGLNVMHSSDSEADSSASETAASPTQAEPRRGRQRRSSSGASLRPSEWTIMCHPLDGILPASPRRCYGAESEERITRRSQFTRAITYAAFWQDATAGLHDAVSSGPGVGTQAPLHVQVRRTGASHVIESGSLQSELESVTARSIATAGRPLTVRAAQARIRDAAKAAASSAEVTVYDLCDSDTASEFEADIFPSSGAASFMPFASGGGTVLGSHSGREDECERRSFAGSSRLSRRGSTILGKLSLVQPDELLPYPFVLAPDLWRTVSSVQYLTSDSEHLAECGQPGQQLDAPSAAGHDVNGGSASGPSQRSQPGALDRIWDAIRTVEEEQVALVGVRASVVSCLRASVDAAQAAILPLISTLSASADLKSTELLSAGQHASSSVALLPPAKHTSAPSSALASVADVIQSMPLISQLRWNPVPRMQEGDLRDDTSDASSSEDGAGQARGPAPRVGLDVARHHIAVRTLASFLPCVPVACVAVRWSMQSLGDPNATTRMAVRLPQHVAEMVLELDEQHRALHLAEPGHCWASADLLSTSAVACAFIALKTARVSDYLSRGVNVTASCVPVTELQRAPARAGTAPAQVGVGNEAGGVPAAASKQSSKRSARSRHARRSSGVHREVPQAFGVSRSLDDSSAALLSAHAEMDEHARQKLVRMATPPASPIGGPKADGDSASVGSEAGRQSGWDASSAPGPRPNSTRGSSMWQVDATIPERKGDADTGSAEPSAPRPLREESHYDEVRRLRAERKAAAAADAAAAAHAEQQDGHAGALPGEDEALLAQVPEASIAGMTLRQLQQRMRAQQREGTRGELQAPPGAHSTAKPDYMPESKAALAVLKATADAKPSEASRTARGVHMQGAAAHILADSSVAMQSAATAYLQPGRVVARPDQPCTEAGSLDRAGSDWYGSAKRARVHHKDSSMRKTSAGTTKSTLKTRGAKPALRAEPAQLQRQRQASAADLDAWHDSKLDAPTAESDVGAMEFQPSVPELAEHAAEHALASERPAAPAPPVQPTSARARAARRPAGGRKIVPAGSADRAALLEAAYGAPVELPPGVRAAARRKPGKKPSKRKTNPVARAASAASDTPTGEASMQPMPEAGKGAAGTEQSAVDAMACVRDDATVTAEASVSVHEEQPAAAPAAVPAEQVPTEDASSSDVPMSDFSDDE